MIAYLDCTTGISGDKLLASLVDAGAPQEAVREALAAIDPTIAIEFQPVMRAGIRGLALSVTAQAEPRTRTWTEIRGLLENAPLAEPVRKRAIAAFKLLAEAEGAVHGVVPDDVHFHEVGAIDSIADVVGVAAALHALGVSELVCGPVAVGNGTVETAHGLLPIPAPATALLLEGVPVEAGASPGEATTPTGAALVRACADRFASLPPMTLSAVGHGAGSRDTPGIANIARVLIGTPPGTESSGLSREPLVELATTVDHLSAEHLAFCCEELLSAGALDVWQVQVLMKKGRGGTVVAVLCTPSDAERFAAHLVELTGTLGVRVRRMDRYVVPREILTVDTSFGPVRVKIAGSGPWRRVRAEYEDVATIARREGLPVDVVAREVETQVRAALADETP